MLAVPRSFQEISTVGTATTLWPFIDSMQPSADISAVATIDLDLTPTKPGRRVIVKWRGRPVLIVHRTEALIVQARADDAKPDLIEPALDSTRVHLPEWLVVVGVCTHLGCIPLDQSDGDPRGPFGSWFCSCHGSIYDSAIRFPRQPRGTDWLTHQNG
ncbi:ubiquinol-cytochrome c reductase iron-sulfur subunit [Chelativorans intermedius]|uniref:ubiquinol-cytochrome c reductase iron-sulfur subunit n=1 Tax=Chelativorans intermedius TaxID=515947 RepID=UPI0021BE0115|nr:ubiquinol-cytochrome c reductase iron-sulfur subunit [Chelativorans intermedius]MCT9000265.1 ubiquinol-cytochrome c reductase iron-sulfur subunit [Chelativorans intermedius]